MALGNVIPQSKASATTGTGGQRIQAGSHEKWQQRESTCLPLATRFANGLFSWDQPITRRRIQALPCTHSLHSMRKKLRLTQTESQGSRYESHESQYTAGQWEKRRIFLPELKSILTCAAASRFPSAGQRLADLRVALLI